MDLTVSMSSVRVILSATSVQSAAVCSSSDIFGQDLSLSSQTKKTSHVSIDVRKPHQYKCIYMYDTFSISWWEHRETGL